MFTPNARSPKTQAAQQVLKKKKLDLFGKIVIGLFTLTFFILEVTFLSSLRGKFDWARFLELNGVLFSTLGAAWTALGVRMSNDEKRALLDIRRNAAVAVEEIAHILKSASNFATWGAAFILFGGSLLFIKIAFFHVQAASG